MSMLCSIIITVYLYCIFYIPLWCVVLVLRELTTVCSSVSVVVLTGTVLFMMCSCNKEHSCQKNKEFILLRDFYDLFKTGFFVFVF